MIDRCEEGDLASIRELVDRHEGRPVRMIDRQDVLIAAELTDNELHFIAGGRREVSALPMKVIPPMSPKD